MNKELIDFNNECWICGTKETYNTCPDCGVDIFLADNGKSGINKTIQYLKDTNLKRFDQMVKQSDKALN